MVVREFSVYYVSVSFFRDLLFSRMLLVSARTELEILSQKERGSERRLFWIYCRWAKILDAVNSVPVKSSRAAVTPKTVTPYMRNSFSRLARRSDSGLLGLVPKERVPVYLLP